MIAGAGQRKRPPKAAKQGQRLPKLNAVCDAELARHPTRVGIVDAQPRLHHAQAIAAGGKDGQSSAQLRRVWADFGFLNRDECAARFRQRIVQRPRLGPRLADRNHDDTQVQAAAISPAHRSGGFGVIAFERENAVQIGPWIIRSRQHCDQGRHRIGFATERANDGVKRAIIAHRWRRRHRRKAKQSRRQSQRR